MTNNEIIKNTIMKHLKQRTKYYFEQLKENKKMDVVSYELLINNYNMVFSEWLVKHFKLLI